MVPDVLGHTSPFLLGGRNLREGPHTTRPFLESQAEQEAPEHSFHHHLQNEGLAVKGNLDGVHSVPIFLRQGQKGSREVSGGQKRAGVGQEWVTGRAGF